MSKQASADIEVHW